MMAVVSARSATGRVKMIASVPHRAGEHYPHIAASLSRSDVSRWRRTSAPPLDKQSAEAQPEWLGVLDSHVPSSTANAMQSTLRQTGCSKSVPT
jgi:hypothetical protein